MQPAASIVVEVRIRVSAVQLDELFHAVNVRLAVRTCIQVLPDKGEHLFRKEVIQIFPDMTYDISTRCADTLSFH